MALPTAKTDLTARDSLPGNGQGEARGPDASARTPEVAPKSGSSPLRHHLSNFLIALSAACLCFIRRWYDLERLEPRGLGYLRAGPIDRTLLAATAASVLILAAVFWLARTWVERHPTVFRRRLGHVVFLLVMLSSLESVRRYWNSEIDRFDWGSNLALAVLEGLLACGLLLLFFGRPRILLAARRVALLLTLLLPALVFDFTSSIFNPGNVEGYANRPSLPMLPVSRAAPRVIWLVFDELDERFTFDARPADLELPELDRLRAESVAASRATETSSWTAVALPSLISGRVFATARMVDAGTLKLKPEGDKTEVDWRDEPNVFKSARQSGVNVSLVGWHHPYCRLFGDELVRCYSLPSSHSTTALEHEIRAARKGVVSAVPDLFRRAGLNLLDLFRPADRSLSERSNEAAVQTEQQQQYFALRDHTYQEAANPNLGLVFSHMPTPHMFPIYNRRERNFDLRGARDYFDNLALVDRTVGELRAALEKNGLLDRTAILLTADHGFRPDNWRGGTGWTAEFDRLTAGGTSLTVPLILKLPGSSRGVTFDGQISNVVAGDLALAVLKGEVSTPAQAAEWLRRHARSRQSAAVAALSQAAVSQASLSQATPKR
jgi:hypothetical protein